MSRIVIVGNSNIRHISLISLYTDYFDKNGIDYDLIYIDRYNIQEKTNAKNVYRFTTMKMRNKFDKIYKFLKFRQYAINTIKENKYDLVICWQATTAYIIFDYLLRNYQNRYIINVRDYIMEGKPIIRSIAKWCIKKAAFVTVSSAGFYSFLPVHDYVKVNSINESILRKSVNRMMKSVTLPIKIGFIGNCRFFEENKKLIDTFANDSRFELWYCGTNSEILNEYAYENGIHNVKTIGAFAPDETIDLIHKFDMVNSVFGNEDIAVKTLVPIRLYTAISEYIPILTNSNTQQGCEVEENNLGFVIKDYSSLPDDVFQYFQDIDRDKFIESCDCYLEKARYENEIFYEKLNDVIFSLDSGRN